jgi:hypothetical protein
VRFVPDVSMLADIVPGYAVYCSASGDCVTSADPDSWQTVGGTSAATPLLAGGLALVDQELRLNGRPDLGFVNPLLYKAGRSAALRASVFSDVLAYSNDVGPFIRGNRKPLGCCAAGRGFDRASGWGSVNMASFGRAAVLLTPPHMGLSLPHPQHVIRRRAVLAVVSCSAACRIGAFAEVRVGGARPFRISSRISALPAAGKTTFAIALAGKQLTRASSALWRHRSVTATVFAVLYGSGNHVQRRTSGKQLRIG